MDENNKEKENKIRLIKIGIYIGIILILIIVLRLTNSSFNINSKENNKATYNLEILETIKNINTNYYTEKIHMTLDDDAITLNFEKVSEIETGIKKYHNTETEYVKYNNNYYKLENENFIKLDNFIDFDYDKTFTKIENIKKLLELEHNNQEIYKSNNLKVMKRTYTIQDAVTIYNEYNNSNILNFSKGEIFIEVYYEENKLKYLIIDITDFFNFLNDTKYNEVKYKIEVEENKEEDIDWLIEKLN